MPRYTHPKGKPRPPGSGRAKGTPNRISAKFKEVLEIVIDRAGGAEGLWKWINASQENMKIFWSQMAIKLLPLQLTGENGGPVQVQRIERVFIDAAVAEVEKDLDDSPPPEGHWSH
jgi:hypothetical protein